MVGLWILPMLEFMQGMKKWLILPHVEGCTVICSIRTSKLFGKPHIQGEN